MPREVKPRPQILVIDDDEQVRHMLLNVLTDRYDCSETDSAEKALQILAEDRYELVISDILLSGISGMELIPRIHEIDPDCVVLMISGQSSIESAIAAMHLGAFDYLTKPLDVAAVKAAIARALKESFLLREQRRYANQLEELIWQRTAEVNQLAYYDRLTELPNRTLFEDRLTQGIGAALRAEQPLGLLFISIDQLQKVNDTLGHVTGDKLFGEAAARIKGCLAETDTVARFGSEEFGILLTNIAQTTDVLQSISAIRNALKPIFNLDGDELFATASVGISLFPMDGSDCHSLMKNAGVALYRARRSGGNNYQFYTADMHPIAAKHLALETRLRHAIENEELLLHYQPCVIVDSLQISGMEALLRWQHPQMGLVPPADFIPLAEEIGLILPIGDWVLREGCRQNREWQDKGFSPMRISVNISARQLQDPDLAETVVQILDETALAPEYLELELTESSIMSNPQLAIDVLTRLKKMGVRVSIDDFGTGFSSLSHLKQLPIDALKIDQSFVHDMTTAPDDAALVMAIITLAHNLKLQVVAEGVETEEQLRFLQLLRCDEMQGFVFSKPLSVDPLERLLASHPAQRTGHAGVRA
ncbi:MAG: putative bifunctional diguanylate cyclase/phosphodiesterase [Pyrinomonadaceae bacterium]